MNLYAYVGNDPVNWIDSSGTEQDCNPLGCIEVQDVPITGSRGIRGGGIIRWGSARGYVVRFVSSHPGSPNGCYVQDCSSETRPAPTPPPPPPPPPPEPCTSNPNSIPGAVRTLAGPVADTADAAAAALLLLGAVPAAGTVSAVGRGASAVDAGAALIEGDYAGAISGGVGTVAGSLGRLGTRSLFQFFGGTQRYQSVTREVVGNSAQRAGETAVCDAAQRLR